MDAAAQELHQKFRIHVRRPHAYSGYYIVEFIPREAQDGSEPGGEPQPVLQHPAVEVERDGEFLLHWRSRPTDLNIGIDAFEAEAKRSVERHRDAVEKLGS